MVLQITAAQMAAFDADAQARFEDRVVLYMRARHLSAVSRFSDAQLKSRVSRALAWARRIGLTWESSLLAFAALSFEIGPGFFRQADIRALLEEKDDTPDKRMLRLPAMTPDRAWREAAQISDPGEPKA